MDMGRNVDIMIGGDTGQREGKGIMKKREEVSRGSTRIGEVRSVAKRGGGCCVAIVEAQCLLACGPLHMRAITEAVKSA